MGARGPRPVPTEILKLRGSRVPERRAGEPNYPRAAPRCPTYLADEAKAEWKRIVPELEAAGVLARIDQTALAAYCQVYARWRKADGILATSGEILKNKITEELYPNPYLGVANKAIEQMCKLLAEFGLSPASRARLNVQRPSERKSGVMSRERKQA